MKIKSTLCAFFILVVQSASAALAAEAPQPGKNPEETARNKAVLLCKTEHAALVEVSVLAFSGKSERETLDAARKRFEADKSADVFYAKRLEREWWISNAAKGAYKVGFDHRAQLPFLSPEEIRKQYSSGANFYVKKCSENSMWRFRE